MIRLAVAFAFAVTLAAPANAACRLALLLALDVSGSVDASEYALQMQGLAASLEDPAVVDAFLADPVAPVSLSVFEWAASNYQAQLVDWTSILSRADLARVADTLRAHRRMPAPDSTGLGGALLAAERVLDEGPVCDRMTLDIAADGQNNDHPPPEQVYATGALGGVTVNALVIHSSTGSRFLSEAGIKELTDYFKRKIIRGPGAFVERSAGYDDFARAMRKKLLRELQGPPIGRAEPQLRKLAHID